MVLWTAPASQVVLELAEATSKPTEIGLFPGASRKTLTRNFFARRSVRSGFDLSVWTNFKKFFALASGLDLAWIPRRIGDPKCDYFAGVDGQFSQDS